MAVEAEVTDVTQTFMDEAFPIGRLTLLLTPPGPERQALVTSLVRRFLQEGKATIVVLSTFSSRALLQKLSQAGVDARKDMKRGNLALLDWYRQQEEEVTDIVEDEGILLCPGEVESLEGALSSLFDSVKGKKAAVVDVLDIVALWGLERASAFTSPLVKKLRKVSETSILLLERDLYEGVLASSLEAAEGVVDLTRHPSERGMVWRATIRKGDEEVATYSLEMAPPFIGFSLRQEAAPTVAAEGESKPCPQCGSSLEGETCTTCGYIRDDSRLDKIKQIYERCKARLQEDPKDVDAMFTKAAALARMKDFEASVETLNELTKRDPRYPGLWMLKAKLYDRLGEEVKANLCRQRALELQEKETGYFLEAKVEPGGEKFQCPLCQRWLPLDATLCPCGAEFVDEG